VGETDDQRIVQPERLAHLLPVGDRSVLPDHVVDRVADEVEQQERQECDDQDDDDRLDEPPDDECQHRFRLGRAVRAGRSPPVSPVSTEMHEPARRHPSYFITA